MLLNHNLSAIASRRTFQLPLHADAGAAADAKAAATGKTLADLASPQEIAATCSTAFFLEFSSAARTRAMPQTASSALPRAVAVEAGAGSRLAADGVAAAATLFSARCTGAEERTAAAAAAATAAPPSALEREYFAAATPAAAAAAADVTGAGHHAAAPTVRSAVSRSGHTHDVAEASAPAVGQAGDAWAAAFLLGKRFASAEVLTLLLQLLPVLVRHLPVEVNKSFVQRGQQEKKAKAEPSLLEKAPEFFLRTFASPAFRCRSLSTPFHSGDVEAAAASARLDADSLAAVASGASKGTAAARSMFLAASPSISANTNAGAAAAFPPPVAAAAAASLSHVAAATLDRPPAAPAAHHPLTAAAARNCPFVTAAPSPAALAAPFPAASAAAGVVAPAVTSSASPCSGLCFDEGFRMRSCIFRASGCTAGPYFRIESCKGEPSRSSKACTPHLKSFYTHSKARESSCVGSLTAPGTLPAAPVTENYSAAALSPIASDARLRDCPPDSKGVVQFASATVKAGVVPAAVAAAVPAAAAAAVVPAAAVTVLAAAALLAAAAAVASAVGAAAAAARRRHMLSAGVVARRACLPETGRRKNVAPISFTTCAGAAGQLQKKKEERLLLADAEAFGSPHREEASSSTSALNKANKGSTNSLVYLSGKTAAFSRAAADVAASPLSPVAAPSATSAFACIETVPCGLLEASSAAAPATTDADKTPPKGATAHPSSSFPSASSRLSITSLRRAGAAAAAAAAARVAWWLLAVCLLCVGPPPAAEAISCRVDAADGLLAAATAAGSAMPAAEIYSFPLCRLPYLVNNDVPARDAPHIGLYSGGSIEIELELLPSGTYANNMPLREPRFHQQAESRSFSSVFWQRQKPGDREAEEAASAEAATAARLLESRRKQKQLQQQQVGSVVSASSGLADAQQRPQQQQRRRSATRSSSSGAAAVGKVLRELAASEPPQEAAASAKISSASSRFYSLAAAATAARQAWGRDAAGITAEGSAAGGREAETAGGGRRKATDSGKRSTSWTGSGEKTHQETTKWKALARYSKDKQHEEAALWGALTEDYEGAQLVMKNSFHKGGNFQKKAVLPSAPLGGAEKDTLASDAFPGLGDKYAPLNVVVASAAAAAPAAALLDSAALTAPLISFEKAAAAGAAAAETTDAAAAGRVGTVSSSHSAAAESAPSSVYVSSPVLSESLASPAVFSRFVSDFSPAFHYNASAAVSSVSNSLRQLRGCMQRYAAVFLYSVSAAANVFFGPQAWPRLLLLPAPGKSKEDARASVLVFSDAKQARSSKQQQQPSAPLLSFSLLFSSLYSAPPFKNLASHQVRQAGGMQQEQQQADTRQQQQQKKQKQQQKKEKEEEEVTGQQQQPKSSCKACRDTFARERGEAARAGPETESAKLRVPGGAFSRELEEQAEAVGRHTSTAGEREETSTRNYIFFHGAAAATQGAAAAPRRDLQAAAAVSSHHTAAERARREEEEVEDEGGEGEKKKGKAHRNEEHEEKKEEGETGKERDFGKATGAVVSETLTQEVTSETETPRTANKKGDSSLTEREHRKQGDKLTGGEKSAAIGAVKARQQMQPLVDPHAADPAPDSTRHFPFTAQQQERRLQQQIAAATTPAAAAAWQRRLLRMENVFSAKEDPLVYAVNNTYVLIMTHSQYMMFEQDSGWVPSFTAPDRLVANSYIAAYKRLSFTGPKLHARISVPKLDRYAVVLLNADGLDLRLKGRVSFINPGNQHLSAEQIPLPRLLFVLMLLHLLTVVVLTVIMLFFQRRRWTRVHLLILGNLLLCALCFALDRSQLLYFQEYGQRYLILWAAARVCKKLQDIVALMAFILIALGWKTLRSQLSRIEVQFVAGLCVISLYLGLFEIILGGFQGTRYILHALGYVCVLVAINFNLALLHVLELLLSSHYCCQFPALLFLLKRRLLKRKGFTVGPGPFAPPFLKSHIMDAGISSTTSDLYHKYDAFKMYRATFFLYLLKPVSLIFFKLSLLNPIYEQLLSWDEWIFIFADNAVDYGIFLAHHLSITRRLQDPSSRWKIAYISFYTLSAQQKQCVLCGYSMVDCFAKVSYEQHEAFPARDCQDSLRCTVCVPLLRVFLRRSRASKWRGYTVRHNIAKVYVECPSEVSQAAATETRSAPGAAADAWPPG